MNRWPREPMDLDFASLDPSGPPPPHALPAFSSSHPALPFTLLPLLLRVSCRPPRSFRGSWFSCGAREPDGGPGPDGRRRGSAIIIQTIFCRDLRGSNLERSVGSTAPVFRQSSSTTLSGHPFFFSLDHLRSVYSHPHRVLSISTIGDDHDTTRLVIIAGFEVPFDLLPVPRVTFDRPSLGRSSFDRLSSS